MCVCVCVYALCFLSSPPRRCWGVRKGLEAVVEWLPGIFQPPNPPFPAFFSSLYPRGVRTSAKKKKETTTGLLAHVIQCHVLGDINPFSMPRVFVDSNVSKGISTSCEGLKFLCQEVILAIGGRFLWLFVNIFFLNSHPWEEFKDMNDVFKCKILKISQESNFKSDSLNFYLREMISWEWLMKVS